MTRTELIEVIRTSRKAGLADDDMAVHEHTQLYTPDGRLIVELCGYNECDTLEPPEGWQ